MKLQLLIAGQLPSCLETRDVWQSVCAQHGVGLEIIEVEDEHGQAMIDKLGIKSFPVLLADGKIRAVGRPDPQHAADILQNLLIS
ncbi:thioredoxin family protein [Thiohalophilus thiocyanatoxydans]|uniref:Thioredoxin-like protein n=1 Tax=Thiohalophilus thiocyanatoxydans TaxID=381308 RepID=A0A4V3H3F5_9GAMM|nr:thioredoxin family protein [Thiohalophilus thiocyanatoxydans]TDX98193.1 thioredoxin-like protein [Thiohalophilus thiocyanatoxydans]